MNPSAATTRSERSSDQQVLLEPVRDFANRVIRPRVAEYDRDELFPADIVREAAELGWAGAVIPEKYGGQALDWLTFMMVIEEISRACHIVGLALSMPSGLVGGGILRYGSEEQKQRWVAPLLMGRSFAGCGVTEPGGGTNVAAMTTTCRRSGDGYVINGSKAWISMLDVGDWFLTFATLDRAAGRRAVCAFIVPRDTPGLKMRPYRNKLGFRPVATGDLVLSDIKVPAENRVGEEGQGYDVAMAAVETGRLSVAARAVGMAQDCLDASVRYATDRMVFGQPIGRFQLVQSMITDMVVGIESARHFLYRVASQRDSGIQRPRRDASLAKMHATDVAMTAATHAVQIHGAYGVSDEYPVGRHFRDAKVFQIIEGNNQIHRTMVAEYELGFRQPDS